MKNNDVSVSLKVNSKIYINDIKIPNGMNGIDENEVNKTSEWNLPHDILNPCKCTKI